MKSPTPPAARPDGAAYSDTLRPPTRKVFGATAALVAANLVPLAGVLWWGWDAFLLLCLYWAETAAIGFWTILKIMTLQFENRSAARGAFADLGYGVFFTVHSGVFMSVHMIFLWSIFSGKWSGEVHGVQEFIRVIIIRTGLWIPLVALFARREPDGPRDDAVGRVVGSFYQRIVLMHLAIILGGIAAMKLGSLAPLIVLILAKTALDTGIHIFLKLGGDSKPAT
jgi:hypothetical protein